MRAALTIRRSRARRPGAEGLESRAVPASLPAGFAAATLVASGLHGPTSLAVAPDGRLFVGEKDGRVRLVEGGVLQDAPVLTLAVDTAGEHGLTGLTVDPDFARNGFLYVTATEPGARPRERLSRFTVAGAAAVPGSEVVLRRLPAPRAGLPSIHTGGDLHFGPDGKLYWAVGDHRDSPAAQRLDNPFGKILRLNPDGSIPRDNPFVRRAQGINRAIYARGFRNPFTFGFEPGTGRLFVNDVGEQTWEEVNVVARGGNHGWPNVEGPGGDGRTQPPFYAYRHDGGGVPGQGGCAIIGAAFGPAVWPAPLAGAYLAADYCAGRIRAIDPATGAASTFASDLPPAVVDLETTPDGGLLYLVRGGSDGGQLLRIAPAPDTPPAIAAGPRDQVVAAGRSATLAVAAFGAAPLSFQWLRGGVPIDGATGPTYTTPALAPADSGARFAVRVTNARGEATSADAVVTVTPDRPPTATIARPRAGARWAPGDRVRVRLRGDDPEQGPLGPASLTWWVELHHDEHVHPFRAPASGQAVASFRIPAARHDAGLIWYRIHLRATDDQGQSTETFVDLRARRFR